MKGKETPKESLEKYTGHMFLKELRKKEKNLSDYATEQKDRNYIFYNPLQPHWQLCNEPSGYRFNQQNFIKMGKMNLRFLLII